MAAWLRFVYINSVVATASMGVSTIFIFTTLAVKFQWETAIALGVIYFFLRGNSHLPQCEAWENYAPEASCDQLEFSIWPAELE